MDGLAAVSVVGRLGRDPCLPPKRQRAGSLWIDARRCQRRLRGFHPGRLGRHDQQGYRLLPGFAPPSNTHSIPTNPARSLEFTVNGTSDDQNNTRIDGVSTAHIQLPHVVSYIPTLESIQEVNVVTNSMDAEQGLAGGAAVNVQTRSGSNLVRGSAFEYYTDQHLKAWPMRFGDVALNTGGKPKQSYRQ